MIITIPIEEVLTTLNKSISDILHEHNVYISDEQVKTITLTNQNVLVELKEKSEENKEPYHSGILQRAEMRSLQRDIRD